ncbi:hypothetical protein DFA_12287 [Cavenderia fasciculata]|uniref:Autophagy-related protein 2 n=1 Tax=Cavenderia fasciculata TaxID=261658 RepID=F4QD40_CACFS|nr:uncharacterized protein DFA_12287 [Cavenderia fasciculata]EGG14511.1 hypothetical protein DFA_12287 [Cavenderia fasciculata]|eukprot:XP_004353925.1 hypothetical protein DFA_12287 [Cavenderia fasciculata]
MEGWKGTFFNGLQKVIGMTTDTLYNISLKPQQRFYRFLINNSIKSYLLNPIQRDEFDTQFNKGASIITLQSVILDSDVLNEKFTNGLPFHFDQVRIERLEFHLPILKIMSDPIRVHVKGVEISIIPGARNVNNSNNNMSVIHSSLSSSTSTTPSSTLRSSISSSVLGLDSSIEDGESIIVDNRPEEQDEVFEGLQEHLRNIFSNAIVEIENMSVFIQTPESKSTIEFNISHASFMYDKSNQQQEEEDNNNEEDEEEEILDREEEEEEEEYNNNNNNNNNSRNSYGIPKIEFDQVSVMVHKKEGSVIQLEHQHYFFACDQETSNQMNRILIQQSTDTMLDIDIQFNSAIKGNVGEDQVSGLMDLINRVSTAFQAFDKITTKTTTNSSSSSSTKTTPSKGGFNKSIDEKALLQEAPPKDIRLCISIPKIHYIVNLPLMEDSICTKPNFKIHILGNQCSVEFLKVYERNVASLSSSSYVSNLSIAFDNLAIDLLPTGKNNETKYRCLAIQSLDDGDGIQRPTISIQQIVRGSGTQVGGIVDSSSEIFLSGIPSDTTQFNEKKYLEHSFLSYRSPANINPSIETANNIATTKINCILPDVVLTIFQSDYVCLIKAFDLSSDAPQTSCMQFTLSSSTANIEMKFDNDHSNNANCPSTNHFVSSFSIMASDLNLYNCLGYPSDVFAANQFDSSFIHLSLLSLDCVARLLPSSSSKIISSSSQLNLNSNQLIEQLFFSTNINIDGIQLLTSTQKISISQQFELTIGEICFIPSMTLITGFLDWIKVDNDNCNNNNNNVKVNNNNNNNNVNSRQQQEKQKQQSNDKSNDKSNAYHIELNNCMAKYMNESSQLILLYDKLTVLVSPDGRRDDLLLMFNPVQILLKSSDSGGHTQFSFSTIKDYITVGYSKQELIIMLKNVLSSTQGPNIEILSNHYDFTFTKSTYNLFTTIVPQFIDTISKYMVLPKVGDNQEEQIEQIVGFVGQSQIKVMDDDYDGHQKTPQLHGGGSSSTVDNNNSHLHSTIYEFNEDDGIGDFEVIHREKELVIASQIVVVDLYLNLVFTDEEDNSVDPLQKKQPNSVRIECHIADILLQNFETSNHQQQSNNNHRYNKSLKVNVTDIFIHDNIPKSPYRNLFGPLSHYKEKKKKSQHLISLILYSRDDSFGRQFYNIKLLVDPLFIQAYQLTIDFLLDFFINQQNQNQNNESKQPQSRSQQETTFYDEIEIFPLEVRIDYKPRTTNKQDNNNSNQQQQPQSPHNGRQQNGDNGGNEEEKYSSFTSGEYVWMFSMIPLSEANFTLNHVHLQNVPGSKLVESVLSVYQPNLLTNGVFQYLGGVAPVRILFNIGSGITALVRKPIQEARANTNAGVGGMAGAVGKGVGLGIQTLTVEILTASSKVVSATSSLLGKLSNNSSTNQSHMYNTNNNHNHSGSSGHNSMDHSANQQQLSNHPQYNSIWVSQPENLSQGAHKAMSQVIGGFYNAAMGILSKPITSYQESGTKGFLTSLLWGVPGVVVSPMVGLAEGFTSFSIGLRNSLDSSRIVNDHKKYKSNILK